VLLLVWVVLNQNVTTPCAIAFDHAVLAVRHLVTAKRNFQRLGFVVLAGGSHAGGLTHNALIPLTESSYLELLAPAKPGLGPLLRFSRRLGLLPPLLASKSPFARYFARHLAAEEGLVDFALHCPDLQTTLHRAHRAGLHFDGPYPGARTKPNGQKVAWQLALPHPNMASMAKIPFLIQDETPRERRIPSLPDNSNCHPNGATSAAQLILSPPNLATWTQAMSALLGHPPSHRDPIRTTFNLGPVQLTAQATRTPLSLHLNSAAPARQLDLRQTHKTHIQLI